VPPGAWDSLALPGVDVVWLMGVWERSRVGREVALRDQAVRAAIAAALPPLPTLGAFLGAQMRQLDR